MHTIKCRTLIKILKIVSKIKMFLAPIQVFIFYFELLQYLISWWAQHGAVVSDSSVLFYAYVYYYRGYYSKSLLNSLTLLELMTTTNHISFESRENYIKGNSVKIQFCFLLLCRHRN